MATGLGLVFWIFVLHPAADGNTGSMLASVINTAYPAADALLLAILARLVTGSGAGNPSTRLIGAGALLLLLGDIGYALATRFSQGGPLDALYLLSYLCFGVGALHPSMTDTRTRGAVPARRRAGMRRLVVLTASSLLAPAMLFLPGIRTNPVDWAVVSGGAVVLFLLAAARTAGFVRQSQRQAGQLERLAS